MGPFDFSIKTTVPFHVFTLIDDPVQKPNKWLRWLCLILWSHGSIPHTIDVYLTFLLSWLLPGLDLLHVLLQFHLGQCGDFW